MSTPPHTWALVLLAGLLGSVAGYVIDRKSKKCVWNWPRLGGFILLGCIACVAVFLLLTAERDVRTTDYLWAGLAGMKGQEVLTLLAEALTGFLKALRGPRK